MVKLSISDEQCYAELRNRLERLHALLTPLTERIAPVDVLLRQVQERLGHYDPTVHLVFLGPPKSGKSSALNCIMISELLPSGTSFELQIHPFDADPTIRLSGRAIAHGADSCRELLGSPSPQSSNWHLHTRLPLFEGNLCYAASWVAVDTPPSTGAICPTLSSLASRCHTPSVFVGDLMLFCIDARVFGTPQEETVFDQLIGDLTVSTSTLRRLLSTTFFILTHIDAITDFEEGITRLHKVPDPTIKTVREVRQRFFTVAANKFPEVQIEESHVMELSAPRGLLARKMLQANPSINDIYEYCETMLGSTFMQTIDELPEEELHRLVKHHSRNDGAKRSGTCQLENFIRLFDFNSVRHMMGNIASVGEETAEQLCAALKEAKPALDVQVAELTEDLETLVVELHGIVGHAKSIEELIASIPETLDQLVDEELQQFFQHRMEELQYVLERRETAWFRERQLGTIVEMNTALSKLDAFLEVYSTRRNFLESRENSEEKSTWSFVDESRCEILSQLEKEKAAAVTNFGDRFAHEIKDEFVYFFRELVEKLEHKKKEIAVMIVNACEVPLAQTQARCAGAFSLEEALQPFLDAELVEANERRTNNLLREMPEHIAFASLQISEEWRRKGVGVERSSPVMPRKNRLKRCSVVGIPQDTYEIPDRLKFVHEAWRLGLATVKAHQLCNRNIDMLRAVTEDLANEVLTRIKFYVMSLEDGIQQQKEAIDVTTQEAFEVVAIAEKVEPFIAKFAATREHLRSLIATDMETARRRSVDESAAQ